MKRKADEGTGRKQGGLSIRLVKGKVKGGNKMQTKTKVKWNFWRLSANE